MGDQRRECGAVWDKDYGVRVFEAGDVQAGSAVTHVISYLINYI